MTSTVPAVPDTADDPGGGSVFDGLVVLDAATLVAGPLISTYLAEYGADVIKIEQPVGGDPIRVWGSMKGDVNLMWKSLGRNKRSATLDLRSPEGQELFRRMAQKADVVVLNTRPSTLEKWGLDHPSLAALNPRLIMVHVTGYGAGGPYSDRPGFGTIGEAMSGFAHVTGEPTGSPTLPGVMLADCVAGVNGAFAVAAALLARHRTGRGQLVDLSLVEPLARFVEQATLTYDQLGTIPTREGNRWSISVPRNTYRTSDDRWIALSGSSPSIALRVYDALGRPELKDDPEYADPHRRIVNRDTVDGMIADWVAARPLEAVLDAFEGAGVAAGPVYDAAQLMDDPHLRARGTFVTVADDELGDVRVQAPVARLSDTPGAVRHLGPALGADNETVYGDMLGLTEDELAGLRRRHVV